MERETGIEPATNSLEGCDSTIELLPRTPLPIVQPHAGPANPPVTATPIVIVYPITSCPDRIDSPVINSRQTDPGFVNTYDLVVTIRLCRVRVADPFPLGRRE